MIDLDKDWAATSACDGLTDLFFPDDDGMYPFKDDAVAVCQRCPVRSECLDYSLATGEWIGVWGGFTPRPRQYMARANSLDDVSAAFGKQISRFVKNG